MFLTRLEISSCQLLSFYGLIPNGLGLSSPTHRLRFGFTGAGGSRPFLIVEINPLDIVANGLFLTGNLIVTVPANYTTPFIKPGCLLSDSDLQLKCLGQVKMWGKSC